MPPLFLLAALSFGDPRQLLQALNQALQRGRAEAVAALFTTGGEVRRDSARPLRGRAAIACAFRERRLWVETTPPRIEVASVRLLDPTTAIVQAEQVRIGSLILEERLPVLLILRKRSAGWLIASWQICPCPPLPWVRPRFSGTARSAGRMPAPSPPSSSGSGSGTPKRENTPRP